jgi:hypothetical protein
MRLVSRGKLRKIVNLLPTVAITVALAWPGCADLPAGATDAPGTNDTAKAKPKADHPPIIALRDRMLAKFHGNATDLFTAIPGFGMERMKPMYKRVPFELPLFSTDEVDVQQETTAPETLRNAFADSLDVFRDPSKQATVAAKDAKARPPFSDPPRGGYGSNFRGTVVRGLQLRLLDLVALVDPEDPKVYAGGMAFEIMRMTAEEAKAMRAKDSGADAAIITGQFNKPIVTKLDRTPLKTRPLDYFETAGVEELSRGKDLFIRHKDNVIRMLGALRATDQCLKCHTEHKQRDLLGAFSYTFVDTTGAVTKGLNPKTPAK